jgi:hypothetical protein
MVKGLNTVWYLSAKQTSRIAYQTFEIHLSEIQSREHAKKTPWSRVGCVLLLEGRGMSSALFGLTGTCRSTVSR